MGGRDTVPGVRQAVEVKLIQGRGGESPPGQANPGLHSVPPLCVDPHPQAYPGAAVQGPEQAGVVDTDTPVATHPVGTPPHTPGGHRDGVEDPRGQNVPEVQGKGG